MLIATFDSTTGWAGKQITYEGGWFIVQDYGPIAAAQVLDYDRSSQITWAYDGLREWTAGLAATVAPTPQGPPQMPARTPRAGLSTGSKVVIGLGTGLLVIILFIAVVASIGTSTETTGGGTSGAAADSGPQIAYTLTADELAAAYNANEISADKQYKGRLISITGTAGDISKDILDDPYVILEPSDWAMPSIQCYLANGQDAAATGITKGQPITIVGTVDGMLFNVSVKGCKIP